MSKEYLPENILHLMSQNSHLYKETRNRVVDKLKTLKQNESREASIARLQSNDNYDIYLGR